MNTQTPEQVDALIDAKLDADIERETFPPGLDHLIDSVAAEIDKEDKIAYESMALTKAFHTVVKVVDYWRQGLSVHTVLADQFDLLDEQESADRLRDIRDRFDLYMKTVLDRVRRSIDARMNELEKRIEEEKKGWEERCK